MCVDVGGSTVNCWLQFESLVDDAESLFDLKRGVVRWLVLLVRRREKVRACICAKQVEIDCDPFLSSVGSSGGSPFRDNSVAILIASDRCEVLAGRAELQKDDCQVDARCGQVDGLQLPQSLAAICGRVP